MEATAATAALEGRYAALRAGAARLSSDELLDVIDEAQREKDAASARQAVALAHLSAREPRLLEDGTTTEVHHGLGHQRLDAPELAAPRMGVSVHVATRRVTHAIDQLTRTPAVVDAMANGDLDEQRAAAVTEETEFLTPESAAAVTALVAPRWAGLTTGPLRRLLARAAAIVDPEAVAAHADTERDRRGLTRRTGTHGTDAWRGEFLVEQSRAAWAAVTELARQKVRDGSAPTLELARADALMELVLDHCDVRVIIHTTRAADPTHIDTTTTTAAMDHTTASRADTGTPDDTTASSASADAATDHTTASPAGTGTPDDTTSATATASAVDATGGGDHGPSAQPAASAPPTRPVRRTSRPRPPDTARPRDGLVEVGGLGAPGTTFVPRAWLDDADHTDSDTDRELVCDPDTGALLSGDVPEALAPGRTRPSRRRRTDQPTPAYRIPDTMARLVRLRDGSCRFPGCATPARLCDLDHARPWPTGPTSPLNLLALCRRHHRIKQRPGWTVTLHPDGTATWHDPTGRTHTTWPVDHFHLATTRSTPSRDTDPGTPAPTTADQPTTFEDELHAVLDGHAIPPRHTRPTTWDTRGQLISGPLPRADLAPGHLPHPTTGRPRTLVLDLPHRPPPPPDSPSPIPF